jgi:hypothetical protein
MTRNLQIEQLIGIISDTLAGAYNLAAVARDAMREGNQNLAIGTLLPLDAQLETAMALHRSVLALHKHSRVATRAGEP